MYYEEAKIKEYFRKNTKGVKTPYYQINLKKDSKFNEAKTIALADIDEVKKLNEIINSIDLEVMEAKLKEQEEEIIQLKQQLKEIKEDNNNLKSENYVLQQDLLTIKDENEAEVKELTAKLLYEKDLTKTLLVVRSDLLNRSLKDRIFNKEPESSIKVAELKELPEANISD